MKAELEPEFVRSLRPPPRPAHEAPRRDRHRGAIVGPRWRFLAEASELLEASLEYQQTLANVVGLAVPKIADYAIIALLTENGSLGWGCSAHRDPAKAPVVARLHPYVPDLATNDHPWAEAIRSGRTQITKAVDDEYLRSIARDEGHLGLLRELEPTSYIVIPLAARGRILGSLQTLQSLLRLRRLDLFDRAVQGHDERADERPRREGDRSNRQVIRRGLLHRCALGQRPDRGGEPLLRPGHLHEADGLSK
jgi:hypothetical protein